MGNANSGRYPKLTAEERRRIIGLVADAISAVDVAQQVKRSASFVYRIMHTTGLRIPSRAP